MQFQNLSDINLSSNPLDAPDNGHDSDIVIESGALLNEYRTDNKLYGVIVDKDSRQLPIDREDILRVAFDLKQTPRTLLIWLSPENTEAKQAYDELMLAVADGRAAILEETKQYDMNKSAFMVFIRYMDICYCLNSRFNYIREDTK